MHPMFHGLNRMLLCAALVLPLSGHTAPAVEPEPARVLILGSFHFDDAGLDAVKSTHKDVMQPAEQQYLQSLAERLAAFKPTHVLLEYPDKANARINAEYLAYRKGQRPLGRNEIDQIGYRVARLAGLAQVHGIDEKAPDLPNPVWERTQDIAPTMALVQRLTERSNEEHRRLSLQQLLEQLNSAEADRENKSLYMSFNAVGAADRSFSGADSAANWWHRNFRIYAQIQRHAQPGTRVLVLAGSGHAAILRDLLRIDAARREEAVQPYLR